MRTPWTDHTKIHNWLIDHAVVDSNYTISETGKVHISTGGLILGRKMATLSEFNTFSEFPFDFAAIIGPVFIHNWASLQRLEGLPETLEFLEVTKAGITSLAGAPREINRYCRIAECPSLTMLQGAPEVIGEFVLAHNPELHSVHCGTHLIQELSITSCPKVKRLRGLKACITKQYIGETLNGVEPELLLSFIQNGTRLDLWRDTKISKAVERYRMDKDLLVLLATVQSIPAYRNFGVKPAAEPSTADTTLEALSPILT